jgi:hypothetical protein
MASYAHGSRTEQSRGQRAGMSLDENEPLRSDPEGSSASFGASRPEVDHLSEPTRDVCPAVHLVCSGRRMPRGDV